METKESERERERETQELVSSIEKGMAVEKEVVGSRRIWPADGGIRGRRKWRLAAAFGAPDAAAERPRRAGVAPAAGVHQAPRTPKNPKIPFANRVRIEFRSSFGSCPIAKKTVKKKLGKTVLQEEWGVKKKEKEKKEKEREKEKEEVERERKRERKRNTSQTKENLKKKNNK